MGLNTYPANPFPPSTDQMDADALEAEVNKLKSGLIDVNTRIETLEKPSNIIAILTAGANVNAAILGVILPKDVQTATITRVIPLGGTGADVNLPLTVTNYDYESRGVIDGYSSAVGSDNLLNIAREYCTQVNISLTY